VLEAITNMYDFILNYWIAILFALFVVYQIYDHYTFKNLLEKVGKSYCSEHEFDYVGIKHAKGHFSVIFKTAESGRRKYQKFRMNAFLGKVRYLEWLK
jgi:hypothetical protein